MFQLLRRKFANSYRKKRYGTKISGIPFGDVITRITPGARELLDIPFRHIPHPSTTRSHRLLDVGCGNGAFLALARTAGWEVFGCDPDIQCLEQARRIGVNIRQGGIEAWKDKEGWFDAVTISHVIEHVHEPRLLLLQTFNLLQPGGFLYIDTPNIDALGHEYYGPFWRGLEAPRHLVLLNWASARHLLAQCGFVDVFDRPRRRVFCDLSDKSARLEAGLDPYSPEIEHPLRLPSSFLRLRARFARSRSEFITLTCRKPEGNDDHIHCHGVV